MPFAHNMRSAVLQLHSLGVDCRILSDANTFFISSFLQSQRISHCFTHIVSNPADWTEGVLRVSPYTSWGHAQPCDFSCPENMCKASGNIWHCTPFSAITHRLFQGSVVTRWMQERDWARVCYVGDGSGDVCGRYAPRISFYLLSCRVSLCNKLNLMRASALPLEWSRPRKRSFLRGRTWPCTRACRNC
jgi:2,3-diketo-5-methylthio-1-phosphopentane phosphatase